MHFFHRKRSLRIRNQAWQRTRCLSLPSIFTSEKFSISSKYRTETRCSSLDCSCCLFAHFCFLFSFSCSANCCSIDIISRWWLNSSAIRTIWNNKWICWKKRARTFNSKHFTSSRSFARSQDLCSSLSLWTKTWLIDRLSLRLDLRCQSYEAESHFRYSSSQSRKAHRVSHDISHRS